MYKAFGYSQNAIPEFHIQGRLKGEMPEYKIEQIRPYQGLIDLSMTLQ